MTVDTFMKKYTRHMLVVSAIALAILFAISILLNKKVYDGEREAIRYIKHRFEHEPEKPVPENVKKFLNQF